MSKPNDTNRQPTCFEEVGIAWWNRLNEQERAYWLRIANSARPVDAFQAYSRGAVLPSHVDGALSDANEPNGWALMEARKQSEEVGRSMAIGDRDTAEKAVDILHGLWLGAAAYESPAGPTSVAILEILENAQRALSGQDGVRFG